MKELIEYLEKNKISFEMLTDDRIKICDDEYCLVRHDEEGKLFSEDFMLMINDPCDRYVYNFGDNWYWDTDYEKPKLNELRYLGRSTSDIETDSFLGIRGAYEILNGSRLYEDWCAKAKFLGCKSLGICEKNTLAGVLKFQIECKKSDVKSIIGATYTVFRELDDIKYDLKFYVKDEIGWENLLLINKEINVINNKFIKEDRLFDLLDGLYVIADPKTLNFDIISEKLLSEIDFYQLDTVEYVNNSRDQEYLDNLKRYFYSDIKPVPITDAFYLEQEHSHIKKSLNAISSVRDYESDNQYFKDKEDYFIELSSIFSEDDKKFNEIFLELLDNERLLVDNCNFSVDVSRFNLPDYVMTEEQSLIFDTKEDLFWNIIEAGIDKKVPKDKVDLYLDRIDTEFKVIMQGEKLIDYFLILWDIIDWCDKSNILVGVGRGSSGGSLIAYLMNITNIDPIRYGLLFERFLNENRVKKSLPDIDSDFEGLRRDEVKAYMEYRFGSDHVCSVGTYGNLKLKMIFTDLSRLQNIPIQEVKIMTSILGEGEKDGTDWSEIFTLSSKSDKLKSFVKRYPDIINDARLCLMQPRSSSIHACATIITPDSKDIFRWFPVKSETNRSGDRVLVSEWEGIQLDSAGFLKEDILGILQLDKISNMIKLIKQNRDIDIDFRNIPLDDKKTYRYFHEGWNEDVFQFGTQGLKKYTRELKPDNIEELSAANALYRPGAMKSNAHNDFVLIKFGKKEIEYDYMLEDVTKETYGLYVYQEQTMLAAKVLGGFSLVEADMMRKVMLGRGKKQQAELFYIYQNKFIDGAVKNGCDREQAENIWDKLEAFAGYGFNKSHAVAYGITGYISQWFKVNYPTEFWTTAFKFGREDQTANYISEINRTGDIKVMPADINKSRDDIFTDFKTKTIYWPLISIKQCGEKAASQIIEIRDRDGQFFSFEEFLDRNKFKGSKVTKQVIENLVMSGAFDEIEDVKSFRDRYKLIQKYRELNKVKVDLEKDLFELNKTKLYEDWWWILQQKQLSGIAFFDYRDLVERYLESDYDMIDEQDFQLEAFSDARRKVKIGGYITEFEERSSKKGKWARVKIESNYTFIWITIWSEQYRQIEKMNLLNKDKVILLISGQIVWDSFKKENILQATDETELLVLI